MNILVLNPDLPVFPGRAGHEHLHTTRLWRLGHRVGLVSLVHSEEQDQKQGSLADAGVELFLWRSPALAAVTGGAAPPAAAWRRAVTTMGRLLTAGPLRPRDTIVQDYQFRNVAPEIGRALLAAHWDAIVVVQSGCARWIDYLPRFPASVLVLHDVRALVHERRARSERSVGRRLLTGLEAWRYRRFESRYCRRYDLVMTVSRADEEWVRRHYPGCRVTTVPIPVDSDYFSPLASESEVPGRIVFTGMMDHLPNVDAVRFFADEVLPAVQARVPGAEFRIVGRDPSPEVIALAGRRGVSVTGFVPDIRPEMARATVIVVPLRYGSGMRNKILEGWAMNKCIVSTSIGAEGLDYRDAENILIADDAASLADRVAAALTDRDLRDRIRASGQSLVRVAHEPTAIAGQYARALSSVAARRRQQDPMRVAVDLRWMHPGVAGGIENLSRSFLEHLRSLDSFNRYSLLVPASVRFEFDLRSSANFRLIAADGPKEEWRRVTRRITRGVRRRLGRDGWRSPEVEQLQSLARLDADMVLSMSGYIRTDAYPLRNVLVVHDLQHEYHPEFFSLAALEERTRVFGESIRRADRIIAVSEHTRRTIVECFGVEPSRVTAAHEAADPRFHPENWDPADEARVARKYGLGSEAFLFYPANTWPHKNHRAALQALGLLRDTYGLRPRLICTGAAKEAQADLLQLVRDLGLAGQVRFLGYCPADDMPALYRAASALVFPSYFEGFGIPLVEAMWCGCPIVAANRSSLPEIAGDAAVLVDPDDHARLAAAIARVLSDAELRRSLIERGRIRARRFTWRQFTLETVRVLRETWEAS